MTTTFTKEVTFIPTNNDLVGRISLQDGDGLEIINFLKSSLSAETFNKLKAELGIGDEVSDGYAAAILELIQVRGKFNSIKLKLFLEDSKECNGSDYSITVGGELSVVFSFPEGVMLTLVDHDIHGHTCNETIKQLYARRRKFESLKVAKDLIQRINTKLQLLNYDKRYVVGSNKLGVPTYIHAVVRYIYGNAEFNSINSPVKFKISEDAGIVSISFVANKDYILNFNNGMTWYEDRLSKSDADNIYNKFLDVVGDIRETFRRISEDYTLVSHMPSRDILTIKNDSLFISDSLLTEEDVTLALVDKVFGEKSGSSFMAADFIKTTEAFKRLVLDDKLSLDGVLSNIPKTLIYFYRYSHDIFFLRMLKEYAERQKDLFAQTKFEELTKSYLFDNFANKCIGKAVAGHGSLAIAVNGFKMFISNGYGNGEFPVYSIHKNDLSPNFPFELTQLNLKPIYFEVAISQEAMVLAYDCSPIEDDKKTILTTLSSGQYYALGYKNAVLIVCTSDGEEE